MNLPSHIKLKTKEKENFFSTTTTPNKENKQTTLFF